MNVRVPRRWLIYLAAAGPGLIAAAAGNLRYKQASAFAPPNVSLPSAATVQFALP